MKTKTVTIPACIEHQGYHKVDVELDWICPVCGGPRGEVFETHSYDGSRRMVVDGWVNPCGHVDKYIDCRMESKRRREPTADSNCPACYGLGWYMEDVCGDGGPQMLVECECTNEKESI